MATVFDVAKYILDKCAPITAMKLQKLCFYAQAMSLAWDDTPLFDEDFEAWAKGPVCPVLFRAHHGVFMLYDSDFLKPYAPNVYRFTDEQRKTIDAVLDALRDYPPYELSQMTHTERPWLDARVGCQPGEPCNNVIPKEVMQEYYASHWS